MSDVWTVAQVSRLKDLWSRGYSASQIAVDLGAGLTRNAVIGKVSRLGLTGRGGLSTTTTIAAPLKSPISKPPASQPRSSSLRSVAPKPRSAARPSQSAPPASEPQPIERGPLKGLRLIELDNNNCRWPFGHPGDPDFYFCGVPDADLANHRPYCPFHTAKARDPARRTKQEFERGAMFAAGIRSSTRGAHHG